MIINTDNFSKQIKCTYKGENYDVRDNGAIMRFTLEGKKSRPLDNNWTFGKINISTGYLKIASISIHRIVATAFHGDAPSKDYVVDHIDTNRQNNRPNNLRWVTRFENIILNPITVRRIEIACGCSIEEFLIDPSKFRNKFREPNYEWMCTVTSEQAQISLERLQTWARNDNENAGLKSLGDWIFRRNIINQITTQQDEDLEDEVFFTESLTNGAVQEDWATPTEFPCCVAQSENSSILQYFGNLKVGQVFSKNQYSTAIIEEFAISRENDCLWVLCKSENDNSIKPWTLAEVRHENFLFIHSNLGSYFGKDGALKQFTLAQGLEWTQGDTFDDYA